MMLARLRTPAGRLAPLLVALLGFYLCAAPQVAGQEANAATDALRGASVSYLEGDYEGALSTLEVLLGDTSLTSAEQARAHELSAFCELALDRQDETRAQVRALLEIDRAYTMQPAWMDDRMTEIVADVTSDLEAEDARAEAEAQRAAALAAGDTTVVLEPDAEKKGGGKTLYYIAGGVAGLLILGAVLGGGDSNEDTLTVLGVPPARPGP